MAKEKMTPAKAERIMRQAFRIAEEDGSIEGFGTEREIEMAKFMATEALRRMQAWSAASDMLAALGTALGLITKHGLAVELAKAHPEDFARLESARAAHAKAGG